MIPRLLQSVQTFNPSQTLSRLHPRAMDFVRLMRLDKPIGIWLLLWPTLWALWIAAEGAPSTRLLLIFTLGTVLMRSAGCVLNDLADREFDGHVERTQTRPLATGKIKPKEALWLAAGLIGASFLLVLCTNVLTVFWSFGALAIAALYPLMKRYTYYPQLVLGAAFSWGMPMAFTAQDGQMPPPEAWLLFLANLVWTVAYDTYYAMADREDDLKLGLKSTAILFADLDRPIIALLQGMALLCLWLAALRFHLGLCFYLGLCAAAACFAWEFYMTRARDAASCFRAFLHNHWGGFAILAGIILDFVFRP